MDNITSEFLLKRLIVPCVVFLPEEELITPEALRYEMQRSREMPDNSRDDEGYFWYDWALVDSMFLQHFLFYVNHRRLNRISEANNDLRNMLLTIETKDVSHKETCLNLLGWAYKDLGHINKAFETFKKSLEVKPVHNAAVLHMKDIPIGPIIA